MSVTLFPVILLKRILRWHHFSLLLSFQKSETIFIGTGTQDGFCVSSLQSTCKNTFRLDGDMSH